MSEIRIIIIIDIDLVTQRFLFPILVSILIVKKNIINKRNSVIQTAFV